MLDLERVGAKVCSRFSTRRSLLRRAAVFNGTASADVPTSAAHFGSYEAVDRFRRFNRNFYTELIRRLCFAGFLSASSAKQACAVGFVGIYLWGGVVGAGFSIERYYETLSSIIEAGFDTVRITVGPSGMPGGALSKLCSRDDELSCYLQIELASPVWDNPRLKRIMITAIDRTCSAKDNNKCLDSQSLFMEEYAIKLEYTRMFDVLESRFKKRRIEFIISNWEGDNFIYGGSAYSFGRDGNFANRTKATWSPSGETNLQRVRAFLRWIYYRDQVISDYHHHHPDIQLIQAPEFNNFRLFENNCQGQCDAVTDTVFDQIAASGGREYCSYSSYDTQGPPRGEYIVAISRILRYCNKLIIGEAGYDLNVRQPEDERLLFVALDKIRHLSGLIGVIVWHAADKPNATSKYGIFDFRGNPQILQLFGPLAPRKLNETSRRKY